MISENYFTITKIKIRITMILDLVIIDTENLWFGLQVKFETTLKALINTKSIFAASIFVALYFADFVQIPKDYCRKKFQSQQSPKISVPKIFQNSFRECPIICVSQ